MSLAVQGKFAVTRTAEAEVQHILLPSLLLCAPVLTSGLGNSLGSRSPSARIHSWELMALELHTQTDLPEPETVLVGSPGPPPWQYHPRLPLLASYDWNSTLSPQRSPCSRPNPGDGHSSHSMALAGDGRPRFPAILSSPWQDLLKAYYGTLRSELGF